MANQRGGIRLNEKHGALMPRLVEPLVVHVFVCFLFTRIKQEADSYKNRTSRSNQTAYVFQSKLRERYFGYITRIDKKGYCPKKYWQKKAIYDFSQYLPHKFKCFFNRVCYFINPITYFISKAHNLLPHGFAMSFKYYLCKEKNYAQQCFFCVRRICNEYIIW